MSEQLAVMIRDRLDRIVPLKALGIELRWNDARDWSVFAPLALNANHMGTGFGGSIATLATLAGWIQTWVLLDKPMDYDIVIAHSTLSYSHPVTASFGANAIRPDDALVEHFCQAAETHGKGIITVESKVFCGGQLAASCAGRFVAVRQKKSSVEAHSTGDKTNR